MHAVTSLETAFLFLSFFAFFFRTTTEHMRGKTRSASLPPEAKHMGERDTPHPALLTIPFNSNDSV